MSKTIGTIDIETYGLFEKTLDGRPLPLQTVFHPQRMVATDEVDPRDVIQTVSITLPAGDAELPDGVVSRDTLCKLEPGTTRVFRMGVPSDVRLLQQWLDYLDILVGHNILFDVSCLRLDDRFRRHLNGRHTLVDTTVLNYLHNELRPERSLKDIGPLLRLYTYDKEELARNGHRYPSPSDKEAIAYNAADTHNTTLLTATLCRMILRDWPTSDKATEESLRFYSDELWTCLTMMDAGICMDGTKLRALQSTQEGIVSSCESEATSHNLILSGPGSDKSQVEFVERLMQACIEAGVRVDTRMLEYTQVSKRLSTKALNRKVLGDALPKEHPLQVPLDLMERHAAASKLISSYTRPMLYKKTSGKKDRRLSAVLVPQIPGPVSRWSQLNSSRVWSRYTRVNPEYVAMSDRALAYPSIYMIPSSNKDGQGDSGGQQQIRLSFNNPGATTFPKVIKQCYTSRFGPEGSVISADASQIELRMAGVLSGEPTILTPYTLGHDLHTLRAIQIMEAVGLDVATEQTKPTFKSLYRQCGKHANFTDLNLGGPDVLQRTILKKGGIHVSIDFCRAIVESRARARPVLTQWQHEQIRFVEKHGYILLPITGVSRYLPTKDAPTIVNCPVQAHAAAVTIEVANVLRRSLLTLNEGPVPQCYMTLVVYDAIYFDSRNSFIPTLKQLLADAVQEVAYHGYWHRLCSVTGHSCPLLYDLEEPKPKESK